MHVRSLCRFSATKSVIVHAGAELPPLPKLVHLNLIHCGAVTDDGLREIAGRFPQVQTLQLKTPWITDVGMGHVGTLMQLERLDLVDCEGVEGPGLAKLVVNHPNLVVSCSQFTNQPSHPVLS